jgi:chemotaxis protein methyltransferase CheR
VDVRILAATNRNLEQEVQAGRFREDLWHRLYVFLITIPPLRERPEDIPLLVSSFVKTISQRLGKKVTGIPQKTMDALQAYSWPGNIRELQNVLERAIILSPDGRLRLTEPLVSIHASAEKNDRTPFSQLKDLQAVAQQSSLEEVEREYILQILEKTYWRVHGPQGAAKILGLNPSTLRARMRKLRIQRPTPE